MARHRTLLPALTDVSLLQARKRAPAVVFIDELDAVGARRGAGMNEERDQTLNQLLTELDGFEGRQGILLLAATNRPEARAGPLSSLGRLWNSALLTRMELCEPAAGEEGGVGVSKTLLCIGRGHFADNAQVFCLCVPNGAGKLTRAAAQVLDPALTRPGRLSRRVAVPLPDEPARAAILGVHLRGTPLAPGSDRRALCNVLARLTGGLSGAELANVVNEAALLAGRRGAEVHLLHLHMSAALGRVSV